MRRALRAVEDVDVQPSSSAWPTGTSPEARRPSPQGIEVVVTGMGQAAAAVAAASWVPRVRAVVVCGVAGGTGGAAGAGDVVLASRVVDTSGTELYLSPLDDVSVPGVLVGPVASVGTPVDDAPGRAALLALGVLAVETEAAAWAAACSVAGVPLLVVRAVLDTPDAPLAAAAHMVTAGESGPRLREVVPVLTRPPAWRSLLRLARAAAEAERGAAAAAVSVASGLLRRT